MGNEYTDLLDILGEVDMTNYCGGYGMYRYWEKHIATPRLQELGYAGMVWRNGEADSFGPLTRIVLCRAPNGEAATFIYG